jgi:membrane protein YqaA with SNARE-associated domain
MIKENLIEWKDRGMAWLHREARGPYAVFWLAGLSFVEASFFVFPPDIILIILILAGSTRWLYLASVTTIASVVGGVVGYAIGYFFFDSIGVHIIDFYHLQEELLVVEQLFNDNAFLVMFTAAFTPLPYKVFVLAGGFFKVPLVAFILASLLGRGLRFSFVAFVAHLFGERLTAIIVRHFNTATLILGIIIIVFLLQYYFDILQLLTL